MYRMYFLVKFFSEEQNADEFRKGRLHARQLSYYKTIEDDTRRDRSEGVIAHLQPGKHKIKINGLDFTHDICGPTRVSNNVLESFRILCMTAGYINERELETNFAKPALLNFLKVNLKVHEDCLKFGKYAVMVKNIPEFFERLQRSVIAHNCIVRRGLVQYYDPTILHDFFPEKEAPFRKRIKYANEKEYRFVFEGFPTDSIDIGDISDITMPIERDSINDAISNMTLE